MGNTLSSLKVNTLGLKILANKFADEGLRQDILKLPQTKPVLALVGQAIADNFDQEGPGWQHLKAKTIRSSVNKKQRKLLADMTDKELERYEKKVRLVGGDSDENGVEQQANRRILQRTGLLKKTATIPNIATSNKKSSGKNINYIQGNKLVWGTDLFYANAMNYGNSKHNVPARPFMVIRPEWQDKIASLYTDMVLKLIQKMIASNR
jgi:phage gpG-like protein